MIFWRIFVQYCPWLSSPIVAWNKAHTVKSSRKSEKIRANRFSGSVWTICWAVKGTISWNPRTIMSGLEHMNDGTRNPKSYTPLRPFSREQPRNQGLCSHLSEGEMKQHGTAWRTYPSIKVPSAHHYVSFLHSGVFKPPASRYQTNFLRLRNMHTYRRSSALRTVSCMGSKIVTCFWSLRLPLNHYTHQLHNALSFTDLTRNMSIAICFPLSWKLLMYARDTLLVASDSKPDYTIDADLRWAR